MPRTIRYTNYFGDEFTLEDPVVIKRSFGTALRGPYTDEATGQEYESGLFYVESARSVERVEEVVAA